LLHPDPVSADTITVEQSGGALAGQAVEESGGYSCPVCGSELQFVLEYRDYYCWECGVT